MIALLERLWRSFIIGTASGCAEVGPVVRPGRAGIDAARHMGVVLDPCHVARCRGWMNEGRTRPMTKRPEVLDLLRGEAHDARGEANWKEIERPHRRRPDQFRHRPHQTPCEFCRTRWARPRPRALDCGSERGPRRRRSSVCSWTNQETPHAGPSRKARSTAREQECSATSSASCDPTLPSPWRSQRRGLNSEPRTLSVSNS